MDITQLLAFSVKNKASDLHLSAGLPPMIRVHGDVRRINVEPLDHKQVHSMVYDIMNDTQRKHYEEFLEIDFQRRDGLRVRGREGGVRRRLGRWWRRLRRGSRIPQRQGDQVHGGGQGEQRPNRDRNNRSLGFISTLYHASCRSRQAYILAAGC